MAGARIEQVVLRRANLRLPFSSDFADRLEGRLVHAVNRRAKYLIVELESGDALVMHLGMSGWFRVLGPPGSTPLQQAEPLDKHDHVVFEMSNGATVIFNDPRRFGFMKILSPAEIVADAALSGLGPEPLARLFRGGGRSRWRARSQRTHWLALWRDARPRSKSRCSTRPSSPAWATSTPARRCTWPGSRPSVAHPRLPLEGASPGRKPSSWPTPSGSC